MMVSNRVNEGDFSFLGELFELVLHPVCCLNLNSLKFCNVMTLLIQI